MRDACLDLVLGSSCAVCGRPGRVLCRACESALPRHARTCWPTPCPTGLAIPMAVGEYDGPLKLLVNAHKERGQFSLVRPLGVMLAEAVRGITREREGIGPSDPLVLVPVPSRAAVVRSRGHDPMLRTTRRAASLLRRWGHSATVPRLLRSVAVAQDQAGLDAAGRARNLAASMSASSRRVSRLLNTSPRVRFIVTDDVLTTGATAREAQRALEAAGATVTGIATVAATRKRLVWPGPLPGSGASLPFSDGDD